MSGTVFPNAMWNPMSSSTGCGTRPTEPANVADDGMAKRVGYRAPYTARSPSVTVRGVACSITCPIWKSSKKLPGFVLLMIRNYPGDGLPEHATSHEQPAASLTIMTDLSPLLEVAPNFRDIAAHAPLVRGLAYRSSELVGLSARAQSVLRSLGVTTVYDLRTQ